MISTRLLARNTAFNLVAQLAPLAVGLIAVPILIDALGPDRFGVLTLAWALIGYFGLFDLGLGRAMTQAVSEALGAGDEARLTEVAAVSMTALFLLGIVGGVLLALLTPWLAFDVLRMHESLRPEAAKAFYLLAISLPFVLGTLGIRGLFEAHQHFGISALLRIPYGLFTFLGPLAVLPFSRSLTAIVGALVLGRVMMSVVHFVVGRRVYPWLQLIARGRASTVVPLLRTGGWMTVSNVVSPLMANLDRFLVGALLSMTAVAFYVTPYEVATKLLYLPGAVMGVFFPAFAATHAADPGRTTVLMDRVTRFLILVEVPIILLLVAFAREGLTLWVGTAFAGESVRVLQILALGVFVTSIGQVSFSFLQATGRADLPAKAHLIELPVYVALIFVLTRQFGLIGVAAAWTLRSTLDTALLWWLAGRRMIGGAAALRHAGYWALAATAILGTPTLVSDLPGRALLTLIVLVLFLSIAWRGMLSTAERRQLLSLTVPSSWRLDAGVRGEV